MISSASSTGRPRIYCISALRGVARRHRGQRARRKLRSSAPVRPCALQLVGVGKSPPAGTFWPPTPPWRLSQPRSHIRHIESGVDLARLPLLSLPVCPSWLSVSAPFSPSSPPSTVADDDVLQPLWRAPTWRTLSNFSEPSTTTTIPERWSSLRASVRSVDSRARWSLL